MSTEAKALTVAELIDHLQTLPQHLPVAHCMYSEMCLLEVGDITVVRAQVARPDGWVHHKRSDKPSTEYVLFPGN